MIDPSDNYDQPGFTGHIKDRATGLNYMQARYYDPVMGRFLSHDPEDFLSQDLNPGYFNRYMYTMNNPINLIDPTGKCSSISQDNIRTDCLSKRAEAISNAKVYLEDKSVSRGRKEAAYIETYNIDTGEVTVRKGNDAARRSGDDVQFVNADGRSLRARPDGWITEKGDNGERVNTNEIVLATGHSHPKDGDRGVDRANEGISTNEDDIPLSRIAPAVIKTPSRAIKVFYRGQEVEQ